MSILKIQKTLPDGRSTEYHKVLDVVFTEVPGTMTIKLGSYARLEDTAFQVPPEGMSYITMSYTGTYLDALSNVIGKVQALPEWGASTLIST